MKKRGFLLAEQVIKIVISLIVLSFLIYFLGSLYFSNLNVENQQRAEGYLLGSSGSLKEAIDNLTTEGTIEFFNPNIPSGWYLFSFVGSEAPTKCEIKNCLCICNNVVNFWGTDRQLKECHQKGSCLIVPELNSFGLEIELKSNPATNLTIIKLNGLITVQGKIK